MCLDPPERSVLVLQRRLALLRPSRRISAYLLNSQQAPPTGPAGVERGGSEPRPRSSGVVVLGDGDLSRHVGVERAVVGERTRLGECEAEGLTRVLGA